MHAKTSLSLVLQLFKSLLKFNPRQTLWTLTLITLKSLCSGVSFLMILPLLELTSQNAPPLHSRYHFLFDTLHLPNTLGTILSLFALMMGLTSYLGYVEQRQSTLLQQGYNQYLRTELQRALLFSHWSFARLQKKSDLIHVLIAETHHLAICNHQLLLFINQMFLITVNTLLAFMLSWAMTLPAIGAGLILILMMFPLHKKTSVFGEKNLHANQFLHQIISEQLSALKMIKGSGLEVPSVKSFTQAGQTLQKLSMDLSFLVAKNKLLFGYGATLFFCAFIYLGIGIYQMPFNQFIMLFIIYARLLPLISGTQQVYQRILHQIAAYPHILELMREAQHAEEKIDTGIPLAFHEKIELVDVSFKYPDSERWILRHLHLQLKKNTSTAILGPSGSGKTTLIDLLAGLSQPTTGQLKIDGKPLQNSDAHAWRTQIAYITQDVFLFNASIRENLIGLRADCSELEIQHALHLAAADFVWTLPHGLDTYVGENAAQLSGGERQRIALARAILQRPKLLILDESTNALDPERVKHIQTSLAALRGKMTIVIISHQAIQKDTVDQILYLSDTELQTSVVLMGLETETSTS